MREGSLEAPTRHPIDWKNDAFYEQEKIHEEMERVFDVCHTCRRCVSLCNSFPTLFDLIDESQSMELDSVDEKDFSKVVDECYLCDMCYLSKCPYVPPHEWNIDFPHLMLRAKAARFKKEGAKFRDKILSSTDIVGKIASIPVVSKAVNKANETAVARRVMEKVLGVHKDRTLPRYSSKGVVVPEYKDVSGAAEAVAFSGRVAIFTTCYVKYNEPDIGSDLLAVLKHNNVDVVQVQSEACCGMPKFELGDLEAVERLKDKNIEALANLADEGRTIITNVPSCTLMFKQELPLMFPQDLRVLKVQEAIQDPFEYLVNLKKKGILLTDFSHPIGDVAYHIPCHLRVQNIGQKTKEILELIPGTKVHAVERCSGHDGTWGVKTEHYSQSMKIGRPVFKAMAKEGIKTISSDCAIASIHIQQGIKDQTGKSVDKAHPITLLRRAYGF